MPKERSCSSSEIVPVEDEFPSLSPPRNPGFTKSIFQNLQQLYERQVQVSEAEEGETVGLTTGRDSTIETELRRDGERSGEGHRRTQWAVIAQLPPLMPVLLAITALSWLAWFPFLLFDTDWMGREVYRGDPSSLAAMSVEHYEEGVRAGALGLLLFALVQGITSASLDFLCNRFGPAAVWGGANIVTAAAMLAICVLSEVTSLPSYSYQGSWVPASAIVMFAVLGGPFAATMVVPFTLAAQSSAEAGLGLGLSMGVLNLAIVVPQIVVSLCSGPLDGLFGGGNVPAFMAACLFAILAATGAFTLLPADLSMSSPVDPMAIPHV